MNATAQRECAIDPGRLGRALPRKWDRIGPRQYRIAGVHRPFYDVDLDSDLPCDCESVRFTGLMCLHEMKARIVEEMEVGWKPGDPRVLPHVLALTERAVAHEREATETNKRTRRTARRKETSNA